MITGNPDYKVSVIIPVYNAANYIEEAVKSAISLPETGEVILIDDGSGDNSLRVCMDIQNKYNLVSVFEHPDKKNHGAAATRNLGIEKSQFNYVSFLDADDYYLPNRFTYEKLVFEKHREATGVYGCTKAIFTSPGVRDLFLENYKTDTTTTSKYLHPEELFKALLFGGYGRFHTTGITLKRDELLRIGLFNPKIRQVEDTEYWLRLSLKGKLFPGSIEEPIAIRRVHDTNSIHNLEVVSDNSKIMYQVLFSWALKNKFSFDIKNSFFIAFHLFVAGVNTSVKKLFWKQVIKEPSMILSSFFLKKIHQLYFVSK